MHTKHPFRNEKPNPIRCLLLGAAALSAAVLLLAAIPAAEAGHRHHGRYDGKGDAWTRHGKHGKYDRFVFDRKGGHRHHRRLGRYHPPRRHRHVDVPYRILHRHRRLYRPYYWDRVYYPDHDHSHVLYRFPVVYGQHVRYEFYPYCEGRLFLPGGHGHVSYRGRRIHVDLGF